MKATIDGVDLAPGEGVGGVDVAKGDVRAVGAPVVRPPLQAHAKSITAAATIAFIGD